MIGSNWLPTQVWCTFDMDIHTQLFRDYIGDRSEVQLVSKILGKMSTCSVETANLVLLCNMNAV